MIHASSPTPGARLGEIERLMALRLTCFSCGHAGEIKRDQAFENWGKRTRLRAIARDLRCGACRTNDIGVEAEIAPAPQIVSESWSDRYARKQRERR